MKKKLYEAPQLAVVALQTAEILLTSEDGLVEELSLIHISEPTRP